MSRSFSVVIPAYNEADSIEELYLEIEEALASIPDVSGVQVIFVDDGSTDDTAARVNGLMSGNGRVSLTSFEKNRWKAAALMAGFEAAEGDLVFTIDADLPDTGILSVDVVILRNMVSHNVPEGLLDTGYA